MIFSFFVGFSKNQMVLDLVWNFRDRAMSSIYWKTGEKAIILEERVARYLDYYGKFYRRHASL